MATKEMDDLITYIENDLIGEHPNMELIDEGIKKYAELYHQNQSQKSNKGGLTITQSWVDESEKLIPSKITGIPVSIRKLALDFIDEKGNFDLNKINEDKVKRFKDDVNELMLREREKINARLTGEN